MGLDMYAFACEEGQEKLEEIAYWRKHNRLHGWMEALYREKDGAETFNCVELPLTEEDLDALEEAVNGRELPSTTGFFFGGDSYENYERWYKEADLAFIKKARKRLKKGEKVFYYSWW